MEIITSRKNALAQHLRRLGSDGGYRRESGEYVCDGEKLLSEALAFGADVRCALFQQGTERELPGVRCCVCPGELLEYVSPQKNSPGPVFSAAMAERPPLGGIEDALVLEGVQDPGNVGAALRSAGAFGTGCVILLDGCADPFSIKAVRASMGAVFRQSFFRTDITGLRAFLAGRGLALYGAVMREDAIDISALPRRGAAVAVGSEGRGLTPELLGLCERGVTIPMSPDCESLNASVAASIFLWELSKGRRGL